MDRERFFSKVTKTSTCWLWTGSLSRDGYGHLRVGHHTTGAHRLSYEIHHGKIPKKLAVCHSCDVRNCVNPEHLFLGSWKDNAIDCILKGRRARKLTIEQVVEIRLDEVSSHYRLGKKFGVDPALIGRIRRGSAWKVMPVTSL